MHDVRPVQLAERRAQGRAQGTYGLFGQRSPGFDGLVERGPQHILRGQPGVSANGSASITRAPNRSPMTLAASTSSRKRVRAAGSVAIAACMVFRATVRPPADRAA